MNKLKISLAVLAAVLVVFLAGAIGYNRGHSDSHAGSGGADFAVLQEVYGILQRDFVEPDKVKPEALEQGAIDGLIQSLHDRHTTYIDPDSYRAGVDPISGTVNGIGVLVSLDTTTNRIVVISPYRGSPAEIAGIRAGDVILDVDGQSTEDWTLPQAEKVIRGPEGTTVRLTVQHKTGSVEELTVTRRKIELPTVFTNLGLQPDFRLVDSAGSTVTDIAYIQLQQFTQPSVAAVETALRQVRAGSYKAIILDLRGNPGGALDATADITDMFMNRGV
ncbi:MAG TPA: PDZ domain-containing protein, partial [Dehalococcoidia bacterium]|nr:PDZ domain-containing protein [Dehalococcoidia bacterium]